MVSTIARVVNLADGVHYSESCVAVSAREDRMFCIQVCKNMVVNLPDGVHYSEDR